MVAAVPITLRIVVAGRQRIHGASEAAIALDGASGRTEYPQANHADDFEQAGLLYSVLSRDEHTRLVNNIVGHMSGIDVEIQRPQVVHFLKANMEYGNRVAEGLKIKI
jgi:catalase